MNSRHIVRSYDEELQLLKSQVLQMGRMALRQLTRALETVISRDSSQAEAIMADDAPIDALQKEIDRLTLAMLARRQPLALDLRNIVSGIRMASDLERIADYSANIARHSMDLNSADVQKPVEGIIKMTEKAKTMLSSVMTAYQNGDPDLARKVWHDDDAIDQAYARLLKDLREFMTGEAEHAKPFTALMFVARCCERIGDHIQNLAENVHFIITAHMYHGK
ncbi:phosphate transport system regulatory protein PhoU [delta proteobacterium NaphS2]|nr:phosphate transport system regulatory protein PhoU [delta proteobacterium NaphS2]